MNTPPLIASLWLLLSTPLLADFKTGQPADVLLGAPSRPQIQASDLAIDPVTHKFFVCDIAGSRVLRYASQAAMESGAAPEAYLGQPDEYSAVARTSGSGMAIPSGIAIDAAGRLWVADRDNHRILRFDNASSLPTGAPASGLLGQSDFNSKISGTAENRMKNPVALAVDAAGRLWVVDSGNNRVLRWDAAASRPSGAFADGVLGQTNFSSSTAGITAGKFEMPQGVVIEHAGATPVRLWVADTYNSRVLGFSNPASKPNGAAADKVLGQPNFTSNTLQMPPTSASIGTPMRMAMQGADLWVVDDAHNRVVRFVAAGSKPNGAAADSLLGQFNYAERVAGSGPANLDSPAGLVLDGSRLWIIDFGNNRLVRHEAAAGKFGLAPADGLVSLADAPAATAHFAPAGAAIDALTGKLFVSDATKNRVVRYASVEALQTGAQPEAVLGQPDFQTTSEGTSASKFRRPEGLHVDFLGNLWVVDSRNSRVLRFANAATLPNGAAAVQVLGSSTFTGAASNTTPTGMYSPSGVVTEWGFNQNLSVVIRRLWVADSGNNRVLRFENPIAAGNGAAATSVLGQPNLTTGTAVASAGGMNGPVALAVDLSGRLWVADGLNQRVLRFDGAAAKANGAAADGVLIQSSFTAKVGGAYPTGLSVSPEGRLFVAVDNENRVLWFNAASTKANGGAPDGALGQPDLVSTEFGGGYRGLFGPSTVILEPVGSSLWVVDSFFIRRFTPELESRIVGHGFNAQNHFFLTILGRGGEAFEIRSSGNLLDWTTLERQETVPGTGQQLMTWTSPTAPSGPQRFYRLQLR